MLLTGPIRTTLEKGKVLVKGFGPGDSTLLAELLRNTQAHSLRLLYGAVAMAVVLFVIMVGLVINYREHAAIVTALSEVFGMSIAGLITLVFRMSKSVTQAGLLLALVSNLQGSDVLEAMRAILKADDEAKD